MLTERSSVRQIPGEGYRRWFADGTFDLIVWYSEKFQSNENFTHIFGFQLCYDKTGSERALSWREDGGFTHEMVDDGESPGYAKMSPTLSAGGIFDPSVIEDFEKVCRNIDRGIADIVSSKLYEYGTKKVELMQLAER